jgi:Nuclease-related domain
MELGMAGASRRPARLAAGDYGSRSDSPGCSTAAGQAAEVAPGRGGSGERGARGPVIVRAHRLNYARRQQYRRLSRASEAGIGAAGAALLGLWAASVSAALVAVCLLIVAAGLGLCARHWLSLARRSRVGARSEDAVQRALAPLQAEGWRLRHSLAWQGRGDIDSVAIAPGGIAIAIETKTRTYDANHLARVREQAAWLSRRRRRWACNGALAVVCLVRARGVERVEDDVLVVSIDRLAHVLRVAAGMRPHAPSRS